MNEIKMVDVGHTGLNWGSTGSPRCLFLARRAAHPCERVHGTGLHDFAGGGVAGMVRDLKPWQSCKGRESSGRQLCVLLEDFDLAGRFQTSDGQECISNVRTGWIQAHETVL